MILRSFATKVKMKGSILPFFFIWRERLLQFRNGLMGVLAVAVMYLASELLIWGLSLVLSITDMAFFSAVLGMAVVLILATGVGRRFQPADALYRTWIKPKVDLINSHVGVAFAIPIVMLDESEKLNGEEIGRVIAVFVTTNVVAWTAVFALAWVSINTTLKIRSQIRTKNQRNPNHCNNNNNATEPSPAFSIYTQSTTSPQSSLTSSRSYIWPTLCEYWTVILPFLSIFAIGVPLAVAINEPRILDAAVVWFIWMSAVKLQRTLKQTTKQASHNVRLLRAFTTLVNPVLINTLLLTAYVRAKSYATPHLSLPAVQAAFSSGSPLYAIWTSAVRNTPLPNNPTLWFGAGDAALSILECGFVIWGFKLYECRRQLFSMSGLITILICVAAAAANVYLAVLTGRLMGLPKAEALAFAARNSTLALAKPAMEAVGGNMVVNAALVVSNGIVGQLLYPCVLDRMGVRRSDGSGGQVSRSPSNSSCESSYKCAMETGDHSGDDAVTIAAGVAVGINGAAMGVAYLYENKSHAAPYAALAMTTYGVMTVLFVAVDPFKAALLGLVSY